MSKPEAPSAMTLQVRAPRHFSTVAMLGFSLYGLLLLLPALFSMVVVSSVPFNWWTYAIPLIALAFATMLLPFGFGNTYASRIARSFKPAAPATPSQLTLVQITFSPRLRYGLRSMMEDADDLGWIYCTESALCFDGDSLTLRLPLTAIRSVELENSGWRAMFLYSRVRVRSSGTSPQDFWIAERASWNLPGSRSAGRQLFAGLSRRVKEAASASPHPESSSKG